MRILRIAVEHVVAQEDVHLLVVFASCKAEVEADSVEAFGECGTGILGGKDKFGIVVPFLEVDKEHLVVSVGRVGDHPGGGGGSGAVAVPQGHGLSDFMVFEIAHDISFRIGQCGEHKRRGEYE